MRDTFDLIEAASERGNAEATAALAWISETISESFRLLRSGRVAFDPIRDLRLNGGDPCERVAEALAVWLKESDGRRFADMTGTRYDVTSLETCGGSGFERLRNQDEFILCAYPGCSSTVSELRNEWLNDIQAVMREDSFNYDAAESAVRAFVAENEDRLTAELAAIDPAGDEDGESAGWLLYVRDTQPESE